MWEDLTPAAVLGLFIIGIKVIILAVCLLCSAAKKIDEAAERRGERQTIKRLLARQSPSFWRKWDLPAPESWALYKGLDKIKDDAFRLGLLQLLAERVLILDVTFESQGAVKIGEAELRKGTNTSQSLKGSLAAVYNIWASTPEPRTIKNVAREAKQKYGSLADFTELELKPRLVEAGLYTREQYQYQYRMATSYATSFPQIEQQTTETQVVSDYLLTPKGEKARDEIELRMSAVLQRLQQERPTWVDEKPQQALMAAVVAVAAGRPEAAQEAEMNLIAQQSEQGAATAVVPQETETAADYYQPLWLEWTVFDNMERTCATVDAGCDAGGGDSGDGGGDCGDGGGDCGDFGGGGE